MNCSLPDSSSMEFFRQGSWSGLPFPSAKDLPDPGIKPGSSVFQADSIPSESPGKPCMCIYIMLNVTYRCNCTLCMYLRIYSQF